MNAFFTCKNMGLLLVVLLAVSGILTAGEVLKEKLYQKNIQLMKEISEKEKVLAEAKSKQPDVTAEDLFAINDTGFQTIKSNVMQMAVDERKFPNLHQQLENLKSDSILLEEKIESCRKTEKKEDCCKKISSELNELGSKWVKFLRSADREIKRIEKNSNRVRAMLDPCFYFCYNEGMHKKYLYYTLTFLTLAISLLAWYSVDRAIRIQDASTWIVPTISFSLLFIFFLLDIILIHDRKWNTWLLGGALFSSIVFSQSFWFLGFFLFAWAFSIWSMVAVHEDIHERIKLNVRKSSAMGAKWILLSLSLVIAGQYYLTLQKMDGEKMFPKFKLGEIASKSSMKIVPYVLPQFETIRKPEATVDDFVNEISKYNQKNSDQSFGSNIDDFIESQIPMNLPSDQKERIRNDVKVGLNNQGKNQQALILEEGRKQLSQLSGRDLSGAEKIREVLPLIVEKKIENYFVPNVKSKGDSRIMIVFFSAALFLTAYSIGIFLDWFLILFLAGILWVLQKGRIISVKSVDAKQEYIEIQ